MNKKIIPIIIIGVSIILLGFEILSLDFDDLGQSLTKNFVGLLVPFFLIISMWVTMRNIEKKNE